MHLADRFSLTIVGDFLTELNNCSCIFWMLLLANRTYTKQFALDQTLLSYNRIELVCDGIDTAATVTLNGVNLGSVNNMFRSWRFDVSGHLEAGAENTLVISVESPISYAKRYKDWYPYDVPLGDPVQNLPYRNFIRKAQSDFGWDWGPGFGPVGVWKGVKLVAYNDAVIDAVTTHQTFRSAATAEQRKRYQLKDGDVLLNVTSFFRLVSDEPVAGVLTTIISNNGCGWQQTDNVQLIPNTDGSHTAMFSQLIPVSAPNLWVRAIATTLCALHVLVC